MAITRESGFAVRRRLFTRPQFKTDIIATAGCARKRHFRYAVVLAALITPLFDFPAQTAHGLTRLKAPLPARSLANDLSIVQAEPLRLPDSALEPIDWNALDGWQTDDHDAAFATFLASCHPLLRAGPSEARKRPTSLVMSLALAHVCQQALTIGRLTEDQARMFFERNFRPLRITKLGDSAGLLTGYYEPIVEGSRFPTGVFKVPIYRRPPDLVPPLHSAGHGFPNRGQSLRRTRSGSLVPYYDRGEILDGALDGRHLEICWIKDQIDALVIQIQGSARVRLEDGAMLHINYDAHNGYPLVPVGRTLIKRNIIPRNEASLERIREWIRANPQSAEEVLRQNRSFVFFRIVGLSNGWDPGTQGKTDDQEAVGAQGVALTPGRSIAVDNALHVYGTPFFIQAHLPVTGEKRTASFDRLVIAQDTGSAIVGPARADIFFGAGDQAGEVAGHLRNVANFAMLVPREIDPVVLGARMPLPPEKPSFLTLASVRTSSPKPPLVLASPSHIVRGPRSDCRACKMAQSGLGVRTKQTSVNRLSFQQPKPVGSKSAKAAPAPHLVTVLRVQQSSSK
jgi:membrane-bound lytic murein transglycosylase A